jgi:hypothetical protein
MSVKWCKNVWVLYKLDDNSMFNGIQPKFSEPSERQRTEFSHHMTAG